MGRSQRAPHIEHLRLIPWRWYLRLPPNASSHSCSSRRPKDRPVSARFLPVRFFGHCLWLLALALSASVSSAVRFLLRHYLEGHRVQGAVFRLRVLAGGARSSCHLRVEAESAALGIFSPCPRPPCSPSAYRRYSTCRPGAGRSLFPSIPPIRFFSGPVQGVFSSNTVRGAMRHWVPIDTQRKTQQ